MQASRCLALTSQHAQNSRGLQHLTAQNTYWFLLVSICNQFMNFGIPIELPEFSSNFTNAFLVKVAIVQAWKEATGDPRAMDLAP